MHTTYSRGKIERLRLDSYGRVLLVTRDVSKTVLLVTPGALVVSTTRDLSGDHIEYRLQLMTAIRRFPPAWRSTAFLQHLKSLQHNLTSALGCAQIGFFLFKDIFPVLLFVTGVGGSSASRSLCRMRGTTISADQIGGRANRFIFFVNSIRGKRFEPESVFSLLQVVNLHCLKPLRR